MKSLLTYLEKNSQKDLAAKLGCHPSAISQWLSKKRVPAERLFQLQSITGIPPKELRPDLFRQN